MRRLTNEKKRERDFLIASAARASTSCANTAHSCVEREEDEEKEEEEELFGSRLFILLVIRVELS